jgi:hypothetical protein
LTAKVGHFQIGGVGDHDGLHVAHTGQVAGPFRFRRASLCGLVRQLFGHLARLQGCERGMCRRWRHADAGGQQAGGGGQQNLVKAMARGKHGKT